MYEQFWHKYPQGSILSDLVQIHDHQYIVRVMLQTADRPLVATLAVADRLEVAAANALEQAMQLVGCVAVPGAIDLPEPLVPSVAAPLAVDLPEPLVPSIAAPLAAPPPVPWDDLETMPLPTVQESGLELDEESMGVAVAPEAPVAMVEPPATAVASLELEAESLATSPPNVTDIIPMINMELKRLGWSREQGRDYMVKLYNKRASSLLSDEELLGLLQNLQAEPS